MNLEKADKSISTNVPHKATFDNIPLGWVFIGANALWRKTLFNDLPEHNRPDLEGYYVMECLAADEGAPWKKGDWTEDFFNHTFFAFPTPELFFEYHGIK